jgi:SAM-dependent methyltransferase
VLAVDISSIALRRAREYCGDRPNVDFLEWDLRQDPIAEHFDLIVAIGVLEYLTRPKTLRAACLRIVKALKPGGYLLVGNTVAVGIENRWWASYLMRGTWINKYVAGHSELTVVDVSLDDCLWPFEHVLLQKQPITAPMR